MDFLQGRIKNSFPSHHALPSLPLKRANTVKSVTEFLWQNDYSQWGVADFEKFFPTSKNSCWNINTWVETTLPTLVEVTLHIIEDFFSPRFFMEETITPHIKGKTCTLKGTTELWDETLTTKTVPFAQELSTVMLLLKETTLRISTKKVITDTVIIPPPNISRETWKNFTQFENLWNEWANESLTLFSEALQILVHTNENPETAILSEQINQTKKGNKPHVTPRMFLLPTMAWCKVLSGLLKKVAKEGLSHPTTWVSITGYNVRKPSEDSINGSNGNGNKDGVNASTFKEDELSQLPIMWSSEMYYISEELHTFSKNYHTVELATHAFVWLQKNLQTLWD